MTAAPSPGLRTGLWARYRWFESISLQQRVRCELDLRGRSRPAQRHDRRSVPHHLVNAQAIWSSEADRLPWMCGRATLRIVLSTPCMMFASMIEIVIMPRFGTGANVSPLTADAPRAASAAHPLAASSPNLTRGARGEGWGECLSGSAVTYPAPAALDQKSFRPSGSGGLRPSSKRIPQNL